MKNKIFFVSCTDDYPFTPSANNTKFGLLAKGLCLQGDEVVIINKYYGDKIVSKKVGHSGKVAYLSLHQKGNKFLASWGNLLTICRILYFKRSVRSRNIVILAEGSFIHHVIVCIFSKLVGVRTGLIFQEWHISFDIGFIYNLNSSLFDKYLGAFVNVIFPISEFIMAKCKHFGKPVLKIPIIADFEIKTVPVGGEEENRYFLYCASTGYFRIIKFILDSFEHFLKENGKTVKLKLVLNGNLDKVREEIMMMGLSEQIDVYSRVSYEQLIQMYASASGLLIPLDPNSLQDQARFSQKIAEYLSSCRPILTTPVGEVLRYFDNGRNALIATTFMEEDYADLMRVVIEDPDLADIIGKQGRDLGREEFDYKLIAKRMHDFILQL